MILLSISFLVSAVRPAAFLAVFSRKVASRVPRCDSSTLTMALVAALVLGCVGPTSALAQRQLRPDIELFIDDMARKHRFDRAALRRVFRQAQPRPAVIRAISTPGTARPWHEFRSRYLDEARIAAGVSFWRDNAAALARASREYGVPEEIIVATIGIETLYGHQTGSFKVLEALTMLAFDYPQRADFFRGELEEFLLLTREAGLDILAVRGSYAGAMGLPQFLPSSYRKYAVDFDGDGKPNLWGEAVDAIGSVANYYRSFGWQPGAPIAVRADPGKSDIEEVLAGGIKPHVRIGALKSRGVIPLVPVDEEAEVTLFTLEAEDGLQYWLGLQNFYVITRYNRSVNYAMAVYELARELRTLVNSNSETPPQ